MIIKSGCHIPNKENNVTYGDIGSFAVISLVIAVIGGFIIAVSYDVNIFLGKVAGMMFFLLGFLGLLSIVVYVILMMFGVVHPLTKA